MYRSNQAVRLFMKSALIPFHKKYDTDSNAQTYATSGVINFEF
ncbi:hypothetical protein NOS3756_52630 [Nostoc sp. NIES-3756]|nr:hypothetical protein NOS3756_52630 [Nostoc sp. NIES-3756]